MLPFFISGRAPLNSSFSFSLFSQQPIGYVGEDLANDQLYEKALNYLGSSSLLDIVSTNISNKQTAATFNGTDKNTRLDAYIGGLNGNKSGSSDGVKNRAELVKYLKEITSSVNLKYISQLAKKVNPPTDTITVSEVIFNTISFYIPSKKVLPAVQVDYLDDDISTVYNFHLKWQNIATLTLAPGSTDEIHSNTFRPLGAFCLSILYSPTYPVTLGGNALSSVTSKLPFLDKADKLLKFDIPTSPVLYERVFPVEIMRNSFDKSNHAINTVSVKYIRLPRISNINTALVYNVES